MSVPALSGEAQVRPHVVEHPTHPGVPRATERDGSPWPPYSPCGPDCLPPEARPARLRSARRTAALLTVIGTAVVTLPLAALFGCRSTAAALFPVTEVRSSSPTTSRGSTSSRSAPSSPSG